MGYNCQSGTLVHLVHVIVCSFLCVLPLNSQSCYLSVLQELTESETIWLKDVTASFQTDKRTLGDLDLPDDLSFHLRLESNVLALNLKRNHGIDPNANVYFGRKLNDGQQFLEKALYLEKEDLAYYQDKENGAFLTVRCVRGPDRQCDRIV
ncbi:hypothetical protein ACJMK2_011047, partial [Sinanodonta woodiana]